MGSDYVLKAIAWMLAIVGGAGVIAGLLGFFGPVIIRFNPWILMIVGFMVFLFGYGLMTAELDDDI